MDEVAARSGLVVEVVKGAAVELKVEVCEVVCRSASSPALTILLFDMYLYCAFHTALEFLRICHCLYYCWWVIGGLFLSLTDSFIIL